MQSLRQFRQLGEHTKDLAKTKSESGASTRKDPESIVEKPAASDTTSDSDFKTDRILVEWEGPRDPLNPRNWSLAYRNWVFIILWINVFTVDWASSADSQAGSTIAKVFGVSEEAEALSPSLYTFGLAAGSVFAGPIAETVGRNPVYVISRVFHVVWLLGAALAPNFGAQCVFRLFAGLNGSILLAIHAASIADIYGPLQRTIAWPLIALASFWGTAASPIAGAWIAQYTDTVSWRWTEWIALILSGAALPLVLFFMPETFSPILLKWKAEHLRRETGDQRYKAELDEQDTLLRRFGVQWRRALHLITREPIVALLGAWLVIEYIVVFGFLQGFKYIFRETYDFNRGLAGTCFAALALGVALWTALIPIYYHLYKKKVGDMHENDRDIGQRRLSLMNQASAPGTDLPAPEYRLWMALLAAPAFPISLFWLAWTNYESISPWSNIMAVVLLGFSWAGIYVTVYQYILDVYGIYAGSALAIITCWRYFVSGATNMLARPVYEGIGVHWTGTFLGILALMLMPAPWVFYKFGPKIRERSAFAGRYSKKGAPRQKIGEAGNWK